MKKTDGRRNADQEKQDWIPMQWIDQKSFNDFLKYTTMGRVAMYIFSGTSKIGTIRVDCNPNSNATIVTEAFSFISMLKPGCADFIIVDPPFVLYDAPGKSNYSVWRKAVKKGVLPESIMESEYFGHPNLWQKKLYEVVNPGGAVISKRGIANCNTMSKIPQMFYVHDGRPSAYNVRVDWK